MTIAEQALIDDVLPLLRGLDADPDQWRVYCPMISDMFRDHRLDIIADAWQIDQGSSLIGFGYGDLFGSFSRGILGGILVACPPIVVNRERKIITRFRDILAFPVPATETAQ